MKSVHLQFEPKAFLFFAIGFIVSDTFAQVKPNPIHPPLDHKIFLQNEFETCSYTPPAEKDFEGR